MTTAAPVPMFTLARAVERIRPQLEDRWSNLLDSQSFIGGQEVATFEQAFAEFLEVPESVGVANGTDALLVAMKALGIAPGDEVIVPAFTFIATGATVSWLGGRPVFVDVEPDTLNIDLEGVAERIGDRTVGVIGVHLYGNPFAADELRALCDRHGLWLLEDAAQAHGARLGGRRVGSFGDLATWSFYPSKNLSCFGDGGAVSGRSKELLERVRKIANHGRTEHYLHGEIGVNSRLDALQAAVLNARLELIEGDNARRRAIAARYRERLHAIPELSMPGQAASSEPVFHQFTLQLDNRDGLRSHLDGQGIGSAIHYPLSLHEQPAFSDLGMRPEDLPVASAAAHRVLCLPMFAELTDVEVERVCDAIDAYFGSSSG